VARLPYFDPELSSPAVNAELEKLPVLKSLNIFRMLAHADSAFVPYLGLAGTLLSQLELDPKLRELAILLVAARMDAEYEWVQHVAIAQALGIDDAQISAIENDDLGEDCFDAEARVLLRFVAQVLESPRPDDQSFEALSERFPPRQIVELLIVIGMYQMLARVMTTLDIEIEDAVGSAGVDEAHSRQNG
jgi:4-carboxymuconolactone decarboxylase